MDRDFRCWAVELKHRNGSSIQSEVYFTEQEARSAAEIQKDEDESVIGYEVHELKRAGKKGESK